MDPLPSTHVAFSDETSYNQRRFRALGLVSLNCDDLANVNSRLSEILEKAGKRELKWEKVRTADARNLAWQVLDHVVCCALKGRLRVDVLLWDTWDSRHDIPGRDDAANMSRMYYHLLRSVLRDRWPNGSTWVLCPDEQDSVDWTTLAQCLRASSLSRVSQPRLTTRPCPRQLLQREFGLLEIRQCHSHEHPLIQVADLFAGLAVFSHAEYSDYAKWICESAGQRTLVEDEEERSEAAKSAVQRFRLLRDFDQRCKTHKLQVSLRSTRGLVSHDPQKPLNFWRYAPQRPEDKAPTKARVR